MSSRTSGAPASPSTSSTPQDIADARHDRRGPGRRGRDRREPAADEPDDGRRVRARADREQGQRVHRRRSLFERRAARRRQHVPRSDRAGGARHHRDRARTVERAVWQRCTRGQRPVPDASTDARRREWHRAGEDSAGASAGTAHSYGGGQSFVSYMGPSIGTCRLVLRERGRTRQAGRRRRLTRRRHPVSGSDRPTF